MRHILLGIIAFLASSASNAELLISGNTISWPDDGWYQVQRSDTYEEICGGGSSCDVLPGTYIVINHTTGKRYSDVVIAPDVDAVVVSGNTISWPDDGWYQVQTAGSFLEVCAGGRSCEVESGVFVVINHTTGERFENIIVGDIEPIDQSPNNIPTVVGNTIYWDDDGWYQVQTADTYKEVCGGGKSCTVSSGTYIVINHSTGERFEDIVVEGAASSGPTGCDAPFNNRGDFPYLYNIDTCQDRWNASAWLRLGTKFVDRRITVLNSKLSETEFTLEQRKADLEAALGFVDLYTTSAGLVESIGDELAVEVIKTGLFAAYDIGVAPIDDEYEKIWVDSIKCAMKATLLFKGGSELPSDVFKSPNAVLSALATCAKTPVNAIFNALALWEIDNIIEGFNEELIAQYLTDQYYRASSDFDIMATKIGADNTEMESLIDAASENLNIDSFEWYFLFPSFNQQDYTKTSQNFERNVRYVDTVALVMQGLTTVGIPPELQEPGNPERLTNISNPNTFISEAVQNFSQTFLVSSIPFSDQSRLFTPLNNTDQPELVFDSFVGGNDQVRDVTSFGDQIFWVGFNEMEVRTLYSKQNGNELIKPYCFTYDIECGASVVRVDIVANNLVVFVSDDVGRVKPYVLSSGVTEFVSLLDNNGVEITRNIWNGDVPMVQVGEHIYFTVPEYSQDAIVFRYDLNLQNPVRMSTAGEIGRFPRPAGKMASFKNKLYFVAGPFGATSLWSWDGKHEPVFIDDVGGISKMVTTTDTLYLQQGVSFLLKSDGSPGGIVNLGFKRYKDLVPIDNTLYIAEGQRGVENWGPMSIYRIVDDTNELELLSSYDREIQTPQAFRGDLYFFDDKFRKIDATGTIETIEIPNFVPLRRMASVFPGDDDVLLFKAYDSVNGSELWSIR